MTKNLLFIITVSLFCFSCSSSENAKQDFNQGWLFALGEMDSNYNNTEYSCGEEWSSVSIPHDWSIESGYTQIDAAGSNGFLPGGVGWYRKEFEISENWKENDVFIRFEAIYNNSTVWLNGVELGFSPNGYLDIEYNLSPHLKEGKNILSVRVDRRAYAESRWYVGGGIYRPVHILIRDKIYIPSHGQLITTPEITADRAEVAIETEILNKYEDLKQITIDYSVSCGNNQIANLSTEYNLNKENKFAEKIEVKNPELWTLENPVTYTLTTKIKVEGEIVETKEEEFGIRTIEFNPEKGFLLNGKAEKLKGVNIHHDLGCLGVALYDKALYRRLKSLKDLGVNAIRTAHNPHSESLLAMCDTMGLLVMNEFLDEWRVTKDKWIIQRSKSGVADSLQVGYAAYFDECAEKDLKHFIRRDFNHPSVIMWSIGNEIEWTYKYYMGSCKDKRGYGGLIYTGGVDNDTEATTERFNKLSGGSDELSKTAKELSAWVKEVDATRPVTSGVVIPTVSRISGYTDALDVVGYNYKDTYYKPHHELYPNQPIIGSENVGQYFEWSAVKDKPYIAGIFLWTGIDYLGENGPWPAKCGYYSLFDVACFKTARGHFFETLWLDTPKTHIVTTPASMSEFKLQKDGGFEVVLRNDPLRRWLWFETFDKWSYEEDEDVVVQIYTNAPAVELFLNGESLGVKSRSDFAKENIILWQIPYKRGELTAVGLDDNGEKLSSYTLITPSSPSQLSVECDSYTLISDGRDLAHIEVSLCDKDGVLVCDLPTEISISIDDKTKILGVDNGADNFIGNHQGDKIVTNNGKALIIVAPLSGAEGEAVIKLSTTSEIVKEINLTYKK